MTDRQDRLGIDFITVLGMPPVEFVALAADLGVRNVGLGLAPIVAAPGFAPWSMREDAALRTNVTAALADRGVALSVGEALIAGPAIDWGRVAADLDLFAGMGAKAVNMISIDRDAGRAFDACARFAALAAERALPALLEYMPGPAIGDPATALAALDHAGSATFRLLIDAMHFYRGGGTAADLAAIDPDRIGYLQLCDVPLPAPAGNDYGREAASERRDPGEGDLPLAELLAAAPAHPVVALEVPKMSSALAGTPMHDRLAPCIAASRALLADAG